MTRLLQQWVTRQADLRPDAGALVSGEERMTYGELEQATNRLARLLRAVGCQRGDRVALLLPKSVPALLGMVGALKADCAHVPLDTSNPPARLAKVLEQCECRCILATRSTGRLLEEILSLHALPGSVRIGWMDSPPAGLNITPAFSMDDLPSFSDAPLGYENDSGDMAHILFTSGSTGRPKGVVITHRNVIHFVEWAVKYFGTSPSDRISCQPPLHFDLSTFDIFGTFAAGAQLHLVPPALNLLPHRLAEFIRSSELTQWFSVPSVLVYMAKFDVVRPNDFPSLRRLLWCGEAFPTPGLIYWMSRLPHVSFTNLYGPTEATIASSYYRVPSCPEDPRAPISIGTACDGEELLVLDESLQPVPVGEVGDLYIRGVGLSPGYWRDPERTAAVFLKDSRSPDPEDRIYKTGDLARIGEDGLFYLLGRADSQVKSRGYRIELGEIEAAMNTIDGVQECAVVAIQSDGFEGTTICCAYVSCPGVEVPPDTVRKRLAELLPHYMIPSRWVVLGEMPKNANGKADRPKLKEEFRLGREVVDLQATE